LFIFVLFLYVFIFLAAYLEPNKFLGKWSTEINVTLITVSKVFLYITFLKYPYNAITNWCLLTVFVFNNIYFPKITFVVTMWTVVLWFNMPISDLLLWTGYGNIALLKTKWSVLTELRVYKFLKNIRFMEFVICNPISTVSNFLT
jgi:hypothetical protein